MLFRSSVIAFSAQAEAIAGSDTTALALFGWTRGQLTGVWPVRTALQTILVGGIAAAAAFVIARAIS